MPKTRSSNTIANRSGGSSGSGAGGRGGFDGIEDREMAERMGDRLNEIMITRVIMESRTRGTMEELEVVFDPSNPGTARVVSESGNTYETDYENGRCTCPHYIHRGERCRHLNAVDVARGQAGESSEVGSAIGQAEFDIEEAIGYRRRLDNIEEESRRALTGEEMDDGYFYMDNKAEFDENITRLAAEDIPYDYANALNGNAVTFGIELEFVDGDSDAIARELYELGICSQPEMVRYHSRSTPGKWKLERDGSVTSGRYGGELVSPILQDTPETWKNIEKICEVVRRHGGKVNNKTGAHVHIGMDQLDTARQRWRRFFKSIAGNEESIYRVAGGELGQYRRHYNDYSPSFEERARVGSTRRMRIENIDDVHNMAKAISNRDRYYGINLTNIYEHGRPDTVEFRYFNGSLNPGIIQANVKLAAGVVSSAEKCRTRDTEEFEVNRNHMRRGELINNTANERSKKGMIKMLDSFFSRKRDKDHVLSILARNTWHW